MTDRASSPRLEVGPAPSPAPDVFRAIYEEHFAYVWHSLRRLGAAPEDIADRTQDVFTAAYRSWGEFDVSRPLRPWLFGICYRIFLTSRRRSARQAEAQRASAQPSQARSAEDQVALSQACQAMTQILETMPVDQRAAFVMHDIDGCSAPEIAEALETPLNTVYSRLRLARRHFNDATARLRERVREKEER